MTNQLPVIREIWKYFSPKKIFFKIDLIIKSNP